MGIGVYSIVLSWWSPPLESSAYWWFRSSLLVYLSSRVVWLGLWSDLLGPSIPFFPSVSCFCYTNVLCSILNVESVFRQVYRVLPVMFFMSKHFPVLYMIFWTVPLCANILHVIWNCFRWCLKLYIMCKHAEISFLLPSWIWCASVRDLSSQCIHI